MSRLLVALTFGRVLKRLRKERGLSQEDLAAETEVDRTYPSLLERGRRTPSLEIIYKLAASLRMPPDELVRVAHAEYAARMSGALKR